VVHGATEKKAVSIGCGILVSWVAALVVATNDVGGTR
jgi:hypothetical protein